MNSTPLTSLTSLLRNTRMTSCVALLFSLFLAGEASAKDKQSTTPTTPTIIYGYNALGDGMLFSTTINVVGGSLVNSPNFSIYNPTFTVGRTEIIGGSIAAIYLNCLATPDASSTNPSFVDLLTPIQDFPASQTSVYPASLYISTNCITTLYYTNSYSGGTTIDGGEIIIGTLTDTNGEIITQGTLGSSSGSLALTNGAYLDLKGTRQIIGTVSISTDSHICNGMLISSSNSLTYDSNGNIVH